MFKPFLFLLMSFCLSSFSQENNLNNLLNSSFKKERKIYAIDSVLAQNYNNLNALKEDLFICANWLSENKERKKAIDLITKKLEYLKYQSKENNCIIKQIKYQLAFYYYKDKTYKKAIKILKTCFLSEGCESDYQINVLAAICYSKINDYYKVINYSKHALASIQESDKYFVFDKSKKQYINSAIIISKAYNKLEGKLNIEAGRKYLLKADSLAKTITLSYKQSLSLETTLFKTYNFDETLDIDKALYYLNKAMLLVKPKKDSLKMFSILMKKGNLYNTTDYDKAIYYHKQSIKYLSKKDSLKLQYYYGNLAYCYLEKKEFEKSQEFSKNRIRYLSGINLEELLNKENDSVIYQTKDKKRLYTFLDYYCQSITKNSDHKNYNKKLVEVIKYYYLIDELISLIQIKSTEYKSKLHWRKVATVFYSKAANVCYLVNDVNSAFYFLEKNKAQLLLHDVHNNEYKQKLPNGILAKEKELKRAVLNATNFVSSETDVALQMEQQKRIFKSKLQYQQYKDSIEQLYPIKTINKTQIKLTSLKKVQQNLLENEVFVSYFWYSNKSFEGSEDLEKAFGVLVSPSNTHFFKISDVKNFEELVTEYKNKVSQPFNTIDERKGFNEVAYQLYNTLFPTAEIRELLQNKNY